MLNYNEGSRRIGTLCRYSLVLGSVNEVDATKRARWGGGRLCVTLLRNASSKP
jgi:hypothetical protein